MESTLEIPEIILHQLGGMRFVKMTGKKNFLSHDKWLRMDLPRNKSGANRLKITLKPDDTYTMEFYNQRLNRKTMDPIIKEIDILDWIYADQMTNVFTDVTGLHTRL